MADYFERLGIPGRFSIDESELERAYLAHSREVHPDFHVAGTDAELTASLDASAAVNEAYNTLRDPFTRAEYMLGRAGGPTAGEHKQMPPAFLAEMIEAREEIESARGQPDALARLEGDFRSRYDALISQVADAFATEPLDEAKRVRIRGLLNAAKYVRGLLRDLHND